MKIFNIVFVVLFVIFAALQYNDPDPYIWVPIYLYSAWFCFKASQKKFYPVWYAVGIFIYLAYATYKIFDANGLIDWFTKHHSESLVESMKAEKPWIEETREFFGLLICVAVLGINWVYGNRLKKKA
ncbi:transmembrane 220 family protein [Mucilaginibacter ginsenosidivorax]|uniref:Transmembrane family 220, helix n=1 Tax=Mucilaginibacter ginsenosidivorax TaxID=862126 RepID=A0A5B8W3E7_9SPHI|nr:transmembrane 220 family protein [Mucilaginibacter ginsenosidivorax]QEC78311.1 hypothetical protein FSB76_21070 [Mucilaginibacter ginsenosidivorax]